LPAGRHSIGLPHSGLPPQVTPADPSTTAYRFARMALGVVADGLGHVHTIYRRAADD